MPQHSIGNMVENRFQKISLLDEIKAELSRVVDSETRMDVLSIRLVRDIQVDGGYVCLTIRPASLVCPVAFRPGALVRDTVFSIRGVRRPSIKVENYVRAAELEALLNEHSSQKGVSDADV